MAVEYKGKHLYDAADADEKRAVGTVWASRSNGKCLFVMPTEGPVGGVALQLLGSMAESGKFQPTSYRSYW